MNIITEHRAAIETELGELLAEKAAAYAGDFDEWLRGEDPDNVGYCYELIESLADVLARPLSLSQKQHRLEAMWLEIWRDVQEEYADAAAWDRENGCRPYADRRGW